MDLKMALNLHYNQHKEALDKKAYEIIQLNKVEEEVPQLEKAE